MTYLLKYYDKSKYFGFNKLYYKEFNTYEEVMIYVCENNINYKNYTVYARINL